MPPSTAIAPIYLQMPPPPFHHPLSPPNPYAYDPRAFYGTHGEISAGYHSGPSWHSSAPALSRGQKRERTPIVSSDPAGPPTSAFPAIAEWLARIQNDKDRCPEGDEVNYPSYAASLVDKGFRRLDDLESHLRRNGTQSLRDAGLSIGDADRLARFAKRDVREIFASWEGRY